MHSPSAAAEIISCARGWLGTRFQHQGRLKKTDSHQGGVDCLGLLIGVANELQLTDIHSTPLSAFDNQTYTRTPDTQYLRAGLERALIAKPMANIQAGDVGLFTIQESPQHLGIISDFNMGELGIIHAYAQARKVVEHALDEFWQANLVAVFTIPIKHP